MPVAVITGASQGLGLALATDLAAAGWSLVVDARDAGRLETAVAALPGGPHVAVPGDVTDSWHRGALAASRRPRRRRAAGQQRQHPRRQPTPRARRPRAHDVRPDPRGQRRRPGRPHRPAAAAAARARWPGPQHHLGRVRRGLRDLGRLRLVQGRARPCDPGARGRGARAEGVRRRPGRPAHRDAPGRLPRRGHHRPTRAGDRRPAPADAGRR